MLITKSMRYEIAYNKELYEILRDMQYAVWRVKNKAISMAYDWQQFSFGYNNRFGEFPKDKNLTGVSLKTDIHREIKTISTHVATATIDSASSEAIDKFNQIRKDFLRGEVSLPSYRRNGSFPIRSRQINNLRKVQSKRYEVDLSLLSREGAKERGCKTQQLVTLRTGKGANDILDRIIDGTYKMSDSRIGMKKEKFYLLLTYQFEKKEAFLHDDRVLGVDVGVNTPAYLAVNLDDYYSQPVGSIEEIRQFENQMEKRKRDMQRQRKHCGNGSIGHGIRTRIRPLDKLSGKIANFKDTKNHNWSRYIVDEALRMQCGVIQMEDLTDIAETNLFLKRWTYYDLQTKIEYKAKEHGIKVVKVKPNYTSARCSHCGIIHQKEDKAKWRPTQDQFICTNCGYGENSFVHADWNAARNIATPDIEAIIKMQVDIQRHAERKKEMQNA